jgi:hypothetical protein
MDLSDNAVCAALASRDRPCPTHPRPLSDPSLVTLVVDHVFGCDLAASDAIVAGPTPSDAVVPGRLAVA